MRNVLYALATAALAFGAAVPVHAQAPAAAPVRDVVQFSASAAVEARQDLLIVTLRVTHEGADPALVQEHLKSVVEAALADARTTAKAGAMEVQSGHFGVQPRQGRDGRISSWQGVAEVLLSGRDADRITAAAGRAQGMTVAGMSFRLSRELRERLESQAQLLAIERFRGRAGEIARAFGFDRVVLREVNLSTQETGEGPRPRLMAAESFSSSKTEAPVPAQAGLATLQVTVSGSVQLMAK